MKQRIFGIDFGTTNSLVSLVDRERPISFVDQTTNSPHPSVLWYRGDSVIAGNDAKQHLDLSSGAAPPGFVRSPKMSLKDDRAMWIEGREISPTDAVAEVLKHLRRDASISRSGSRGENVDRAVMTIPVNFSGTERRALRNAAAKAGIRVAQFVHEPVAALYAHLRNLPNMQSELAALNNRNILVFDWGGGTLDLTLCRIMAGRIVQIANLGNNEIGGDRFDQRLLNLILSKHARQHSLSDATSAAFPGMAAKLINQCERVKIKLSSPDAKSERYFVKGYFKIEGTASHLDGAISRSEFETETADLVHQGLALADTIMQRAGLTPSDIHLCLAIGGMVNLSAIRSGLNDRFLGRVPHVENADRIIAEGAAWIAHDNLQLTLAKPIEIFLADTSGQGTYYPVAHAGWRLPFENEPQNVTTLQLFCTDTRSGTAIVELATPIRVGTALPTDPRRTLCVCSAKVDSNEQPLIEAIECTIQFDDNYIGSVTLKSSGMQETTTAEFHDLEFGLALPTPNHTIDPDAPRKDDIPLIGPAKPATNAVRGVNTVRQRNVTSMHMASGSKDDLWRTVPGDVLQQYRREHFSTLAMRATEQQQRSRNFHLPCTRCGRVLTRMRMEGRVPECRSNCKP